MEQEIKNGTYTIPEGFIAKIEDGKIIVEKAESDSEKIRKILVQLVQDAWDGRETAKVSNQNAYEACMSWLEKQKEQKPAEWSEKDEKMLDNITLFISGYADTRVVNDWVAFLKSLRPQPKAELDAVAEKEAYKDGFLTARYNSANAFMQYLDEHRPEGKMCLSNGECEDINKAFEVGDWAKIIRYINKYQPHWKPSEEQMDALKNAQYMMSQSGDYYDTTAIIDSLITDLQKLL